jgi:hypothetical protein
MRSVLDRRHGPDADAVFAQSVLRSLGVARGEASEIVGRAPPEPRVASRSVAEAGAPRRQKAA